MKIDRLYALTVYLLNHGKTSGAELAKKFKVSVRAVQRDMDVLCKAGIPVAGCNTDEVPHQIYVYKCR